VSDRYDATRRERTGVTKRCKLLPSRKEGMRTTHRNDGDDEGKSDETTLLTQAEKQ